MSAKLGPVFHLFLRNPLPERNNQESYPGDIELQNASAVAVSAMKATAAVAAPSRRGKKRAADERPIQRKMPKIIIQYVYQEKHQQVMTIIADPNNDTALESVFFMTNKQILPSGRSKAARIKKLCTFMDENKVPDPDGTFHIAFNKELLQKYNDTFGPFPIEIKNPAAFRAFYFRILKAIIKKNEQLLYCSTKLSYIDIVEDILLREALNKEDVLSILSNKICSRKIYGKETFQNELNLFDFLFICQMIGQNQALPKNWTMPQNCGYTFEELKTKIIEGLKPYSKERKKFFSDPILGLFNAYCEKLGCPDAKKESYGALYMFYLRKTAYIHHNLDK